MRAGSSYAASEASSKALVDEPHGIADVDGERLDSVGDGRAEIRWTDGVAEGTILRNVKATVA